MPRQICRLYAITPPDIAAQGRDAAAFKDPLATALDAGDVATVQLRLKDVDDDTILRACDALRDTVQSRGVALIMNDRPDLAVKGGCDGVHVGQEDAGYAEARRIVGKDAIVGVTCYASRHLAMEAAEAGADYVAFGGFFRSTTKTGTGMAQRFAAPTDPELITWWQELMTVPVVVIGGITVENCGPLVAAGADFLAVTAGIWSYKDGPAAAVRDFNAAILRASPIGATTK
jgi:thiamine-phosphate pyrophosphorylase